jgi:hypothetical protein
MIIISNLVFVVIGLGIFHVVYEKLLEERGIERIRIEECLDVAEQIFNVKSEKIASFNGCKFSWDEKAITISYKKMTRSFAVQWIPDFLVNVTGNFSMDNSSDIDGSVAAGKIYFYADSKLLSKNPNWTESIWKEPMHGLAYLTSTQKTIIFNGWRGMKTTQDKSWNYYAAYNEKATDAGYQYSNLIFQTGSVCYYTSFPNCAGERRQIVNLDDGMKNVLPEIALWKGKSSIEQNAYTRFYRCNETNFFTDSTSYVLQTGTISLAYQGDLLVKNGTENISLPFEDSLFEGCALKIESGYYADLNIGAKSVEMKNVDVNKLHLQGQSITASSSSLYGVTLTASNAELYSSLLEGNMRGTNFTVRSSTVRRAAPEVGADPPPILVRIIH